MGSPAGCQKNEAKDQCGGGCNCEDDAGEQFWDESFEASLKRAANHAAVLKEEGCTEQRIPAKCSRRAEIQLEKMKTTQKQECDEQEKGS